MFRYAKESPYLGDSLGSLPLVLSFSTSTILDYYSYIGEHSFEWDYARRDAVTAFLLSALSPSTTLEAYRYFLVT